MRRISYSKSLKKDYQGLPAEIQTNLGHKLKLLLENPHHPSLRLKKMGRTIYWEASVTMNYRLILRFEPDEIKLIAIGTHDILNRPLP